MIDSIFTFLAVAIRLVIFNLVLFAIGVFIWFVVDDMQRKYDERKQQSVLFGADRRKRGV